MDSTLTNVFLSHRKSLMWRAMLIVRDQQVAEDVTQETFIRASQAMDKGQIHHLEAFLHQTVRNLAIDFYRRRNFHGSIERDGVAHEEILNVAAAVPSPEACLIQSERLRLLGDAMKKLPERAQKVWYLNRVEKWTYPRIAEHLGVSPNTVFNDFKLAHSYCVAAMAKIDHS